MDIDHQADKEKTARNFSSALLMRFLRYPFLVLYAIIIPRLMGAEDYGKYAFTVASLTLVSEFLTLGTTMILGRFALEYATTGKQAKLDRLFSTLLTIRLMITAVIGIIGTAVGFWMNVEFAELLPWLILYLALIIDQAEHSLFSYLYGLNHIGHFFAKHLLRTLFRLLFIIILYSWLGFTGAVLTLLLSPLGALLIALYYTGKLTSLQLSLPNIKEFQPHIKFGIATLAPMLLLFFQQQIGTIFLKIYAIPDAEIGIYDLANQGFLLIYGLMGTGFTALIPIASKFNSSDQGRKSVEWLLMFLRYALPSALIILVGFYALGKPLIELLLGSEYIAVYPIMLVMLLGAILWTLGDFGYAYSVVTTNPRPYMYSMLLSTLVFVSTAIIITKTYGALAIALATVFAGLTYAVAMITIYQSQAIGIVRIILQILIASLVWTPLFLNGLDSIVIRSGYLMVGLGLFLFALFKFGLINPIEIKRVWHHYKHQADPTRLPLGQIK